MDDDDTELELATDGHVRVRGVRVGPLRSLDDVSVELARLYRSARAGQMATSDASKLAYTLSLLAKVIESSLFEHRLAVLEELALGGPQQ